MSKEKRAWVKPMLTVLTRGEDRAESVLASCKAGGSVIPAVVFGPNTCVGSCDMLCGGFKDCVDGCDSLSVS